MSLLGHNMPFDIIVSMRPELVTASVKWLAQGSTCLMNNAFATWIPIIHVVVDTVCTQDRC